MSELKTQMLGHLRKFIDLTKTACLCFRWCSNLGPWNSPPPVEKLNSEVWFLSHLRARRNCRSFCKRRRENDWSVRSMGRNRTPAPSCRRTESGFVNVNKKLRTKLGLVLGEPVTASLKKDTSEYGLPMPDEFSWKCSIKTRKAMNCFHALTPGKTTQFAVHRRRG